MKRLALLFLGIIISLNTLAQKSVVIGEIEHSTSDSVIYLYKYEEDLNTPGISIPLDENTFEYTISDSVVRVYHLLLPNHLWRGSFKVTNFFNDADTVYIKMDDSEATNKSIGGELTNKYQKQFDSFITTYNPKFDKAYQELEMIDPTQIELIQEKKNEIKEIYFESMRDRMKIVEEDESLLGIYYLMFNLLTSLDRFQIDESWLVLQAQKYTTIYPEHPYSDMLTEMLLENSIVKVGNKFIDYDLPIYDGERTSLSSMVNGKHFILNLWASWCGPCIKKSRDFIEIYNKYNGDKFTIIGTAREFENLERYKKIIEKEQFPWVDLIELDDEQRVWWKYQIPYGGGVMLLVNDKGIVEKVGPTPEEVEEYLSKVLE